MHLPWRDIDLGKGPIQTSLTAGETEALERLARAHPRVLEVGAAFGYSTVVLAQAAEEVVSFDPHQALGSFEDYCENLTRYGVQARVRTVAQAFTLPLARPFGPFDLAFIDADHTYAAVRQDILMARMLLAPGGVIACHDYGEVNCPEVKVAIDEAIPEGTLAVDTLWIWQST